MIVTFNASSQSMFFIPGKRYKVLSKYKNLYRIEDEYGEDYLFSIKESSDWIIKTVDEVYEEGKEDDLILKIEVPCEELKHQENIIAIKEIAASRSIDYPFTIKESLTLEHQVDLKHSTYIITQGTFIHSIRTIATGDGIHCVSTLIEKYRLSNGHPTPKVGWKKMRGTTIATLGGIIEKVELHWYQCPNVGKVEFKIKRVLK
ncbi:hypothetical protein ACOI1C_21425 [Bacillus sp. DJP31]|uniref:hypothetical protein n=1 Tax=Bacillus sp. DJP31 TaxID=3409789 RepID=UPI003BB574FE